MHGSAECPPLKKGVASRIYPMAHPESLGIYFEYVG
jgi:hypothetical protein